MITIKDIDLLLNRMLFVYMLFEVLAFHRFPTVWALSLTFQLSYTTHDVTSNDFFCGDALSLGS